MRNEKKKKNKEEIKSGDQSQKKIKKILKKGIKKVFELFSKQDKAFPRSNQTIISTAITSNQDKTEAKDLTISSENSFNILPEEMITYVFSFFNAKELKEISTVDKQFNRIANDSRLALFTAKQNAKKMAENKAKFKEYQRQHYSGGKHDGYVEIGPDFMCGGNGYINSATWQLLQICWEVNVPNLLWQLNRGADASAIELKILIDRFDYFVCEKSDNSKEFCEKQRRGLINNIFILLKHGMILDESHITHAQQLANDSKNPSQYKPLLQTLNGFQKKKANQDQPVSKFKSFK